MKCPNCQKVVKQTPGKREKVFCNSTCRSNFWAKEKRKENGSVNKPKAAVVVRKTDQPTSQGKLVAKLISVPSSMPKGLSLAQQIDWKIKNGK